MRYPFQDIEPRWQRHWETEQLFRTPDEIDPEQPKYYILDMFPYPSGSGLHVGHPEGYTATDILARYKRMRGFQVLHPMGWDAFGLPAEQYALETGTHPAVTTRKNIDRFRAQLQSLGFSYDWSREISTTDPDYYKWTQWIFLQLYKRGLAYQAEIPVNWCPALGTVLANEEVVNGRSERGNHPVERRPMRQWVLRITEYAERLLHDLDDLDWPESIKQMQRNWIGRSEGAEVDFPIAGDPRKLRVYTTRPDTLFGATYMVLAPEHEWVDSLTTAEQREAVQSYREQAAGKSDLERTELQKTKTGVFTGAYAINPMNGESIPIWIADYVLASYGTGAIMAVPGHDERDYAFARTFDLPIVEVISGGDLTKEAFTGDGVLVHSANEELNLNGLNVEESKKQTIAWLEKKKLGAGKVNYKLRDWLFSRQRYWGEPFPIVFVDGEPRPIDESELPIELPEVESYQPTGSGESPLAAIDTWKKTQDSQTGEPALRETHTMPQWAGSCWYYLRFIDPKNPGQLVAPEKERYWMPVDLYVGGAEHAVLHLLYARFWHKVLYDAGVVHESEPFRRLVNQGMILGEVEYTLYLDADGVPLSTEQAEALPEREQDTLQSRRCDEAEVEKKGDSFVLRDHPEIRVRARAHKMSKSRGNVINPDVVVERYGADSLRLYEMFMGPLEQVKPWSMKGVEGVHRFLGRVWRLITDEREEGLADRISEQSADRELEREHHALIRKVTEDIEGLRFNTAIAAMMEYLNSVSRRDELPLHIARDYVLLLSPFAPHLAEELWTRLGASHSLAHEPWPAWDADKLVQDEMEIPVQINGKMRAKIMVPSDADQETILRTARANETVASQLTGKTVIKEILVPGRLLNFVVR